METYLLLNGWEIQLIWKDELWINEDVLPGCVYDLYSAYHLAVGEHGGDYSSYTNPSRDGGFSPVK
jgi:hypothetical protein